MNDTNGPAPHLPPIVRIVLCQGAKARAEGTISQAIFDAQIARLTKEELCPRCLVLLERELADGRVRFLIKRQNDGAVCEMIEWPEAPAEHVDAVHEEEHPPQSAAR